MSTPAHGDRAIDIDIESIAFAVFFTDNFGVWVGGCTTDRSDGCVVSTSSFFKLRINSSPGFSLKVGAWLPSLDI